MANPEMLTQATSTDQLRRDLQSTDCQVVARAAEALMAAGEHLEAAALAQTRACPVSTRSGRRRVGLARSYLHLLDPEAGARAVWFRRDTGGKETCMELRLNDDEARLLLLLLERAYGEIKYQISDADDSRFKAQLREEKALMDGMMQRLREQGVEAASVAFPPIESRPAGSA